jgi:hypothetical protein
VSLGGVHVTPTEDINVYRGSASGVTSTPSGAKR